MADYSIDVTFAYARLGLDIGTPVEIIEEFLNYARAYRYISRERIKLVERLVEFFTARDKLGSVDMPFSYIRRAYHKQAMMLHPDRNHGNHEAEEQLKTINTIFALVDNIHREARDYYRLNPEIRESTEKEARRAADNEMPLSVRSKRKPQSETKATQGSRANDQWTAPKRPGRKYMAASIPRFIRQARLNYMSSVWLVGCWYQSSDNDVNYIYDIVMLPEREFMRARIHLASPGYVNELAPITSFMPAYIPKDVKTVVVPEDEPHPERYAREYFKKEFGLEGKINE